MGDYVKAIYRLHWFNPANQQKALKLAMSTEKRLERNAEAYRAEFYRFWAAVEKLGSKDVQEQLRSCGCVSCGLKTRRPKFLKAEERRSDIIRLHQEGLPAKEIAKRLGLDWNHVCLRLR